MINKKLIERFLDGDVSKKEKEIVKNLLLTDKEFKKEFNLRLEVNNAISDLFYEYKFVQQVSEKRKKLLTKYLKK